MATAAFLKQQIDLAAPLHPTHILYIRAGSGRTQSEILDVTSQLQPSYTSDIDNHFLESSQQVFNANPATTPTWRLVKVKFYSSSDVSVISPAAAGGERAKWHSPVLGKGNTKISFPTDSPHCSHRLEVMPVKMGNWAMGFVKDSVTYAWQETPVSDELRREGKRISLYKAYGIGAEGKKFEVARYRSFGGWYEIGGVLVVEAKEVDVLVAVLTLCATLGQKDSFFVPGVGGRASSSSMFDPSMGMATM